MNDMNPLVDGMPTTHGLASHPLIRIHFNDGYQVAQRLIARPAHRVINPFRCHSFSSSHVAGAIQVSLSTPASLGRL